MPNADPYANWSLTDRLPMLAFEVELAHLLPLTYCGAVEAIDRLGFSLPSFVGHQGPPRLEREPRGSDNSVPSGRVVTSRAHAH